jgi:hypothetical protein
MTNKQHAILNMSLLPLAIILVLILGVGYFLLQGEIKLPKFNRGPQIGRLENFPTVLDTTKDMEKIRKVLKSEAELDEFLNTVDGENQLSVKEKINWDKQFVLAVTTSTNEESGHKIKIAKAYENKTDKTLLIRVTEVEKGGGCDVEKGKNIAIDLVTITKTDYTIEFEREKNFELCESGVPKESDSSPNSTTDIKN